jgi:hypothetical protein
MAIWEFTEYNDEELEEISKHCKALSDLGIEQDEEMISELHAEQERREEEDD